MAIAVWQFSTALGSDGVEAAGAWGVSRLDGDRCGNSLSNGALEAGEDVALSFGARTTGAATAAGD